MQWTRVHPLVVRFLANGLLVHAVATCTLMLSQKLKSRDVGIDVSSLPPSGHLTFAYRGMWHTVPFEVSSR
jgi:hypothetical protein